MKIYLAGAMTSGNLKPRIVKEMKLYLASAASRKETRNFLDFLLNQDNETQNTFKVNSVSMLESFYADEWVAKSIPLFKDFLLDSGAFTFFSAKNTNINWEEYVDRYANFINENKVDKFFELDIDKLIGYDKVIELRKRLESKTGKQCIPVWHRSRGKENFLSMCDEYPYVAIGGIASKEIGRKEFLIFSYLINEAHKRKAKIHGLGFTWLEGLRQYHFDSVDSTAWLSGNQFGSVYRFNGRTLEKYQKQEGQRMKNSNQLALHNFIEWVKFQKYAEVYL